MGSTLARDVLANLARVPGLEIHLIVSDGAKTVLKAENELTFDDLTRYAHTVYDAGNMAASPSSGSWRHSGMVICPCSMSSLASIATGAGDSSRRGCNAQGAPSPGYRSQGNAAEQDPSAQYAGSL